MAATCRPIDALRLLLGGLVLRGWEQVQELVDVDAPPVHDRAVARRQFLNDPDEFVRQALEGLVLAHPSLELHTDPTYVLRADRGAPKVALVSGGGSGHVA